MAECRFDFPQHLCEETCLKSHDDPGNRSRCYLLKRSVGEENVNPYNRHLLRAWQADWISLRDCSLRMFIHVQRRKRGGEKSN